MEILAEAYNDLRRCELTKSQYDFSARWLGNGKSHYSWIKCTKADPSIETLTRFLFRIERKIERLDETRDPIFPEVIAHDVATLREVRGRLVDQLRLLCL